MLVYISIAYNIYVSLGFSVAQTISQVYITYI